MFNHSGFRYLNRAQTRWTYTDKQPRAFYVMHTNRTFELRHVDFFESVPTCMFNIQRINVVHFRIKGRRYCQQFIRGMQWKGLPVVDMRYRF